MTHQTFDSDQILFILARQAQRRACKRRRQRERQAEMRVSRTCADTLPPSTTQVRRSSSQTQGDLYETKATRMLEQAGLELVGQQMSCPFGEIDLIARDGSVLVFIEVRARSSTRFGGAAASITPAKQRKLIQTAKWWLPTLAKQHFNGIAPACRFDVIAFESTGVFWCRDAIRIHQDK